MHSVSTGDDEHEECVSGPEVEVLSLATMRWVAAGHGMPVPLPAPRSRHVVVAFDGGRVVAAGGWNVGGTDAMLHLVTQVVQWVPGNVAWGLCRICHSRGLVRLLWLFRMAGS